LKLANLARDGQLVQLARDTATSVLDNDPYQNLPENQILWNRLNDLNQKNEDWSRIS
jgi:ATP-dependent DNA helicase RecG